VVLLFCLHILQAAQQVRELTSGPEKYGFLNFSFSPDSKQVVFSRADDTSKRPFSIDSVKTWIENVDGSNPTSVLAGVADAVFSADGRKLFFTRKGVLGTLDLSTKVEDKLNVTLQASSVMCDPRGQRLAFMAILLDKPFVQGQSRQGEAQVFTCKADGSDLRQLTNGPGFAYNPKWSPDGSRLIFYRELGDQKDQIYRIKADGSHLEHLSDFTKHNYYPDFGPDRALSYTCSDAGGVKVVFCNGRGRITGVFPYATSRLVWSPDGKTAMFTVGSFGKGVSLYLSDKDGKMVRKLS
jgi:Tol biopolymer transport system component